MTQHTFPPPPDGSVSPMVWYRSICKQPGFINDPSQAAAVAELDFLWQELVEFKAKRNQFLGRNILSPEVPYGLYLWGGVGRGKSFLMDVFYACVPYERKRRIHFHNFMTEVHHEMKLLAHEKDPLMSLANKIGKSTRLLCFDEFHVSDIADAMILSRLLASLFERGVVMIITSNYSPNTLYPNGLQRQKFLPAIELLQRKLRVINIENGMDLRLREMPNSPLFMLHSDGECESRMDAIFGRIGGEITDNIFQLEVQGRYIKTKKIASNAVWFDFDVICGGPRAQQDYLEIAHKFSTVFISDIQNMPENKAAEAQRFVWLIDILYDNRVKLVASSFVPANELCISGEKATEFVRTSSRITEMQTQNYLELQHQTESISLNTIHKVQ